jgi:hypothetical protein
MGGIEIILLVASIVVGILATAGFTVVALTPAEFRIALRCFWAAALVLGGMAILWGVTTEQPLYRRLLVTAIVGAVAIAGLNEALRWVAKREAEASGSAIIPLPPPLKLMFPLFAECHLGLMPKIVPPEGRILALNLFPTPVANGGGGLVEHFATAGTEWTWPTSTGGMPLMAYRCQITSYSNIPVSEVALSFRLKFIAEIKDANDPNTLRSGPVTLERDWPIRIAKIDSGADRPFVFYVYNITPQFVEVRFPSSATGKLLGDPRVRIIAIDPSTLPPMTFSPFHEEKKT